MTLQQGKPFLTSLFITQSRNDVRLGRDFTIFPPLKETTTYPHEAFQGGGQYFTPVFVHHPCFICTAVKEKIIIILHNCNIVLFGSFPQIPNRAH